VVHITEEQMDKQTDRQTSKWRDWTK